MYKFDLSDGSVTWVTTISGALGYDLGVDASGNAYCADGTKTSVKQYSNAGGVATSGLEMSQNAMHLNWTQAEVEQRLQTIMRRIHATCVEYGSEGSWVSYVKGANSGAFIKVADAMIDQGVV